MPLYAFDGTGNEDKAGDDKDTNVFKFYQAYRRAVGDTADKDYTQDLVDLYIPGVGTRFGWFGRFFGGIFGAGGRGRLKQALTRLEKNLANGEREVDIIGFSRGAAMAVHFANEVEKLDTPVSVRFLGLWDIVGSFGLPGNRRNLGWDIETIPETVSACYHAMALDEGRLAFPLTRPTASAPQNDIQAAGRFFEVWFRGVHSDIGGGNTNTGLSSISLTWMLTLAQAQGLPIPPHEVQRYAGLRVRNADIRRTTFDQEFRRRPFRWNDRAHESVSRREGLVNPPANAELVDDTMTVTGLFP